MTKEKVIVMEQEMEVLMMEIMDAVETLCVAATTARSLVRTIMRKMIAVRGQQGEHHSHQIFRVKIH